jgi:hypothetical protein
MFLTSGWELSRDARVVEVHCAAIGNLGLGLPQRREKTVKFISYLLELVN